MKEESFESQITALNSQIVARRKSERVNNKKSSSEMHDYKVSEELYCTVKLNRMCVLSSEIRVRFICVKKKTRKMPS